MTSDLKPYSEYKEIDLPWLDRIPAHWSVAKLRTILHPVNSRNSGELPLLSVTREKGVIQRDRNNKDENHNFIPEDLSNYKVVRKGQFAINKMKAWQGSYGISKIDGIVSPAYYVFDQKGVSSDFFHFAIRSKLYVPFFWQASDGIRVDQWDLSIQRMKEIPFLIPPLEEQNAIVRYLDHIDNLIKRYICAKQKKIKLLNEQKQAIIQQVVTRGLDPTVKFKPSGIDWLEDIPENWNIRRLRFLATIKTGGRDTVDRNDNGKFPFFVRSQIIERIDTFSFDGEAVLTAGDGAGVAKVFHYFNGKFDYHQRVYRFSNFKEVKGKYFFYFFSNFLKYEAFKQTAKSTVDSLRLPMLQDFPVVVPSLHEQDKLVQFIDQETANMEDLISAIKEEIRTIKEFHTRVTADVITCLKKPQRAKLMKKSYLKKKLL